MTLEELIETSWNKNLAVGSDVWKVYYKKRDCSDIVDFIFTNTRTELVKYVVVSYEYCDKFMLQHFQDEGFLESLSIKPKQKEESKMKTEFKQAEPKKPNTYPSFMLNKTKGYVVLFFRDGCGVVVSGCNDYEVNHFSTSWLMELFTPVEGCSVTFSDKD